MRTKNGGEEEVWMRPSCVRALGKVFARKFRLSYSVAADAIVRSCGFADFEDALVNPRKVSVPLDVWLARLEDALGVNLRRVYEEKELRVLYYKVFVDTVPTSLQQWRNKALPQRPRERPATDWAPEDDFIPAGVSHEQTVVDDIVRSANLHRRVVRQA